MQSKDNIEELISKHLEELNETEPREGHFERFEAKIKTQHKKRTITISDVWKVAAAVVFVFLAVNQAVIYFSSDGQGLIHRQNNANVSLASVSPEYQEVEFYYTNAINVGLNQWNKLKDEGAVSKNEQVLMDNELKEFEKMHQSLQNDLAANPNDERVINAMLEYYQSKLNVINIIVDKLKEVKQLKEDENKVSNKNI